MFIEAFEPLHLYGIVCFLIIIGFLLGIICATPTSEKEHKKSRS